MSDVQVLVSFGMRDKHVLKKKKKKRLCRLFLVQKYDNTTKMYQNIENFLWIISLPYGNILQL